MNKAFVCFSLLGLACITALQSFDKLGSVQFCACFGALAAVYLFGVANGK